MENDKKEYWDLLANSRIKILFKVILIVFLLAGSFWLVAAGQNKVKERKYIGGSYENRNIITVSGTGEIFAKPDLGIVGFSVVTEKSTVAEAVSANAAAMNGVIGAMKALGVQDKDLKTTGFNIYPRYEYKGTSDSYPYPSEGQRLLAGYEVRQSLEVKIRDLTKVGEIVQGATEGGANEVSDLQFTVENQDDLIAQARQQAIDKAKDQAQEIASQLGIKLVRIVSFGTNGYHPIYYEAAKGIGGVLDAASVPQIATGENKISVSVTITYQVE